MTGPAMRTWWTVVLALAAVGALLVPLVSDGSRVVPAMLVVAALPAVVTTCARVDRSAAPRTLLALGARDWIVSVVLALGLHGWVGALGPTALLLVPAAGVPPLLWTIVTRRPAPSTGGVDAMSVTELASAWRRTGRRLTAATDAADRLRIVGLRASYLDELDRRDHEAFVAWLAADPTATLDPLVFFDADRPPESRAS